MKFLAELREHRADREASTSRQERMVVRPSVASTVISIGPFVATLRGDASIGVELDDIEHGLEATVASSLLGSAEFRLRIGPYDLRVAVEGDPDPSDEDTDDAPTAGSG